VLRASGRFAFYEVCSPEKAQPKNILTVFKKEPIEVTLTL